MNSDIKAIRILKTDIAQVTYAGAIELFERWLADDKPARTVIAANVHLVTEAALQPEYAATVADADLVTADGMPLVWASRLLGGSLKERCYGPTLMEKTLEAFQNRDVSHYLYGSTAATLEKLRQQISEHWPDAKIAGSLSPPFGDFNDDIELKNIAAINAAGADFVWVGMGCPKQEQWMQRYRRHLDASVILATGAAFDFIAGTVSQAPSAMQRLGLEWLYRFAMEPKRLWRRYCLRNPYFIAAFLKQYLRYVLTQNTET